MENEYNNISIEILIGIFTIDKGKIKMLLMHKKDEPYKGYWILPGAKYDKQITLEDNVVDIIYDKLGFPNLYIEQYHTFSDMNCNNNERVITTTFMGLIDNITLVLKKQERQNIELEWFDIDSIPKTGYDHDKIISKLKEYLKNRIINSNILKVLFPSDFTLPEIQKVYESILNIKLDRRNFRKKLLTLDYIEDTGDKNEGYTGRPAKLYRFKEELEERNLF